MPLLPEPERTTSSASPLAQPWVLPLPVRNEGPTVAPGVRPDARLMVPLASVAQEQAVNAATPPVAPVVRAHVVSSRLLPDVGLTAPPIVDLTAPPVVDLTARSVGSPDPSSGATLLISIGLPGRSEALGVELRPSRIAAAWFVWLVVTFAVIAFWLPAPARQHRGDGSPLRRRSGGRPADPPSPTAFGGVPGRRS